MSGIITSSPAVKAGRKSAVLANTICVFLWGFSFISIKIAVSVFPPMTLGAVRFAVAILLLFIMYRLSPEIRRTPGSEKIFKRDIPFLAASGLAGVTFYFFCENNGVALVTASEASIIVAAIPVLTMTVEWLVSKIQRSKTASDPAGTPVRPGRRQWFGVFISIMGVILVAGVSFALSGSIAGYLYMGGAALCWVAYGFLTKPLFDRGRTQLYIVFWQNVFGFLGFLPFAVLEYPQWGTPALPVIFHVLFLAVFCSALGYWLYAHALKVLGVSVSSVFINLIPVVTVIAGFFFLNERLTGLQWAGAALVLTGVYLTVLPLHPNHEVLTAGRRDQKDGHSPPQ
jgi:drug/metabolite transporter (DMT)-like permease